MYQFLLVVALVSAVSADMIDNSGCGRMEKIGVHNQWRWIMMAGEERFQFNGAVWNRLSSHFPEAQAMEFGNVKGSDLPKQKLQQYVSRVLGAFDSSLALLDQEAELDRHLDYLHNRNEEMALDSRVYKIVAEEIQNEAAARLGEYYAKTYWPKCINFIKSRVTPTQLPGSPHHPQPEGAEGEGEHAGEQEEDNEIVLPGPGPKQLPEEEVEDVTESPQEAEDGMTTALPGDEGEAQQVAMTEAPEVLLPEPAADPVPETLPELPEPETLPEVAEPANMPEVLAEPANLPEPANVPVNLPEDQPVNLPEPAGDAPVPETLPEVVEPELQPAMGQSLYRRFFK